MQKSDRRGRAAEQPSDIPAAGWRDIGMRVFSEVQRDHVSVVGAGVAFFGLLALFPAIAALMSVAGLVTDPATVQQQLSDFLQVLPENAASIIETQAQAVASSGETGLGFAALLGVVLSIYGASKGMRTLMEGMNIAYDEEEKRGFFKKQAVSLVLTLFVVVGLLLSIGVIVVLPPILATLGLPDVLVTAIEWGRWILLAVLSAVGLSVLYRYGPSREDPEWRWVTWGAVIATVLWVAGSLAFSIYVRNFGSYNETYGTLGGVIILLTWLWLSAFIVLLGAEINSEMEHQTRRDSTTGRDLPRGQRGAVKADEVGETP
ncbi:YihY/virulence factor BrkB family protein [Pseudooceanicola algae]|uniref:Uncharacterized protein n=1 Tax=Pseudooceanicola algae TaxID=1537215 RepID=A0A418SBM7_9RHOB|nr:YihY/virulence factor BrkB family protein [Pseudooceanicola algae]QPM92496.1 hypothetical protein PSAL_037600 [Pseudooceanicola algae]